MRRVTDFPFAIEEHRHLAIPMPDGTTLSARLWLPEGAREAPVPAILEYIPYRKNDATYPRDAEVHRYFAGHGYASVRLDIRGSGESEGIMTDEYTEQELQDGFDAIQWLAQQPWCSGKVGMIGISWGGFNGLQVAAKQPPALSAVVTVCSTDDRYADDVHYMNGCLLNDNLSWASTMFARNTAPPDPTIVGEDRWRAMWLERLEHTGHWLIPWLTHQRRDAYWKHGSVCEDFTDVRCPVMAVSGYADGYVRSVFRLLENLDVPRKGLVGPWAHKYPHLGRPGPAIGFLQECLRWWDRYLKDRDNGVDRDPMLHAYIQDPAEPRPDYDERPGRWVAEASWPSENMQAARYLLTAAGELAPDDTAADADRAESLLAHRSPAWVGGQGGKWCSYANPGDQPGDQRPDDAGSLVFDTAPLEADLDVLGQPVLDLGFSVDRPVAMIAVRLNDVHPDGQVTRATYAPFNLCHLNSHATPETLEPGKRYRVRVPLKHVGQRFAAGHRIRVAISTGYWPLAWPSPEPVTLSLVAGSTALELPERTPRPDDGSRTPVLEAEAAEGAEREIVRPGSHRWQVTDAMERRRRTVYVSEDYSKAYQPANDLTLGYRGDEWLTLDGDDPATATGETKWWVEFERPGWEVRTVTRTKLTCDAENFYLEAEMSAQENGEDAFHKTWQRTIPRDHL